MQIFLKFSLILGVFFFFFGHPVSIFSCDEELKKWRCHSVCSSFRSSFCPSLFFLLVSLEFLLVLNGFNGASRLFKGYLKFKGSFKDVSRKFQGCVKEVLRVFTENVKDASRKFKGCFKEVSRVVQGIFREISRVFQWSFKGVSTKTEGFSK